MKKLPLLLFGLLAQAASFQPLAAAPALQPRPRALPAAQQGDNGGGLSSSEVKESLQRAIEYLTGREGTGGPKFSDYVVINGASIAALDPEHAQWFEKYKAWVSQQESSPERPQEKLLHLISLDIIGETGRAQQLFKEVVALNQESELLNSHYAGWYLYGCVVSNDEALVERVTTFLSGKPPGDLDYMIAYSFWKAFEKTGEEKYKEEFLTCVKKTQIYRAQYLKMKTVDGHAGLLLGVLCRAFQASGEESYRDLAGELAAKLLETQGADGSWNDTIVHTVTPAEGLALYLATCY